MELVPSIDLRGGQAVSLHQGVFASERPADRTPTQLFRQFAAAGARRLHIVDLDGARDGVAGNHALLSSLAALKVLRIQAGGGIRRLEDLVRVLLAGIERAVVGSIAVESPRRIGEWIQHFGADRVVVALDVRMQDDGTPRLATHGWQHDSAQSLWEQLERLAAEGVNQVLCTDIARDGAMVGPNLALYRECVQRFPAIAWQASGGVRSAADLHALAETGVAAAICGRALVEGRISQREMAPFLPAA